jgi:serine/threonine protein kinase
MSKVVWGFKEIWDLNIIHRDIKLANILLHFPDNTEIDKLARSRKIAFLKEFDLTTSNFKCYISDFGLSTIRSPDSNEK